MPLVDEAEMYGQRVADDYYLTLPQVAELLHLSARTVFNMTRDGRLPARRLPGTRKYLYVRREIIELVDQHRTDNPPIPAPAEESRTH
jgi:excisionase family DNA binding protein